MSYVKLLFGCIFCISHLVTAIPQPVAPNHSAYYGSGKLNFAMHTVRADDAALRLVREAGFSWVVQLLEWREVVPVPERWVWEYPDLLVQGCEYYGLNLALRIDHPPAWAVQPVPVENMPIDLEAYTEFVQKVAQRYRGRVQAYIIWNEPNLSLEWQDHPPDPAAYTELLKAAYRAVKSADPEAIVVSAGLAPTNEQSDRALDDRAYLQMMYASGAKNYFDVLGAHPYGFAYPPDDPPEAHESLNFARLSQIRRIMIQNGDEAKPIWATEMGWTTSGVPESKAWQQVSPEQQAEFLVNAFKFAIDNWPWLQLMAVWNLGGPSGQEDIAGYRIVDGVYHPLPAYHALSQMDKPPQAFRELPLGSSDDVQIIAPDVVVHLGDSSTVNPGWSPLYCDTAPCRKWTGRFYVPFGSHLPETVSVLKMEIMQVEEQGNLIRINGEALSPQAIPLRSCPDYVTSWTTTSMHIPGGTLRHGHNTIEVWASPRPIPYQSEVRFESLQIRNIRIIPLVE